jgi:hypothetical protein
MALPGDACLLLFVVSFCSGDNTGNQATRVDRPRAWYTSIERGGSTPERALPRRKDGPF